MGNYKGNPQVEDGYTKISNELLEQIYAAHFNSTQFKIIMCVMRYTYGFNRKTWKLSNSFIAEAIGMSRRNVIREVNNLRDMHVLITERYSNTSCKKLGINKKYSAWMVPASDGDVTSRGCHQSSDVYVTSASDGDVTKLVTNMSPKKEKLKENNKEKYKGDSSNQTLRQIIEEDTEGMTFEELQKALEASDG